MELIDFIKNNREYFSDFFIRNTGNSIAIEESDLTHVSVTNMENHVKAMNYLLDLEDNSNLPNISRVGQAMDEIKKIDKIITNGEVEDYRKRDVMINGTDFLPPPAWQVRPGMRQILDNYFYNTEEVIRKIAIYHIEFERLHPFEDGNGRTGRLFVNYELIRNNIPPVVINLEDKEEYCEFLRSRNVDGLTLLLKERSKQEREILEKYGYVFKDKSSTPTGNGDKSDRDDDDDVDR